MPGMTKALIVRTLVDPCAQHPALRGLVVVPLGLLLFFIASKSNCSIIINRRYGAGDGYEDLASPFQSPDEGILGTTLILAKS